MPAGGRGGGGGRPAATAARGQVPAAESKRAGGRGSSSSLTSPGAAPHGSARPPPHPSPGPAPLLRCFDPGLPPPGPGARCPPLSPKKRSGRRAEPGADRFIGLACRPQMCRPPSRRRSRPPWGHPKRQRPRPVPSPSRPVPIAPSHGAQSHGAGEGDTGGDLPRSAGSPLGMPRGCETSLKIRQSDVEPLDASGRCCCRAGAVRRSPPQLPAVSQGRARCHPAWYGDERPSCVTKQGATTPPSSAPWGHRSLQLAEEAQQRPVEVPRLVQVAGMASARQHDHTVPGEVPEAVQGLVAQAGVPVTVQDQGGRLKKRGERRDVREGDANPYPSPQEAAGLRKAEGGQSPAPPEPWPSTCPHGHLVKAYVPVAPICTDKFPVEQYAQIKTPTLIVYGDQDVELGQASLNNLRHLPEHQVLVLQGAGHACYLDKPEEWHRGLLAFLQQLE
uniref:Abhydrolase domain containing 14B n=1 Tax=Anser brachyrhynchus TaxID=132585 RepID=A0A8B9C6I1_9AVES